MKKNSLLRLFAIILTVAMLAVSGLSCTAKIDNGGETNTDAATDAPVITASPDGEVTASPTKEADAGTAEATEAVPVGTEGAEPTGEAGDATEGPSDTEAASTSGPITTIAPADTDAPKTQAPFGTLNPSSGPSVTPAPTPRPATPAPSAGPTPTATPLPNNSYEAHYGGAEVDCANLKVGDSFFWTLDLLNEHSRLWSGHWLVDYPEQFLEVSNYSVTWAEGISAIANAQWDDDESTATTDKCAFVCNPTYMGNTGGKPLGETGNMYANIGMYLLSCQHYGVQIAGPMVRLKFTVKQLPTTSQMKHDDGGYYLEIPVLVFESTATIDAPADCAVQPYYCTPHGTVTTTPGKAYFKR